MNASRTARDRARAELTREITDAARRQLATSGADGLSLRAVARELGLASSAIYRYFPSRDHLLTTLIIDAYDALGAAAELTEAKEDRADPRGRWRAICRGARAWAREHPHEYALIFGSPIPGYAAPRDTVAPASRVPLLFVGVLRDAASRGTLRTPPDEPPLTDGLAAQVATLAALIAPDLPGPTVTRTIIAWTQLFGMLSFELFGQFVGSVDPSDEFFEHATAAMAQFVGLPA